MATIAYIKFENRDDELRGVHELTTHGRVSIYRGRVYGVRRAELQWLDRTGAQYREATEQEVETALGSVRHPAATAL